MAAEKTPQRNMNESDDSGAVPPLPSWAGILVVVVLVGIIGLMLLNNSPAATNQLYQSPTPANPTSNIPTAQAPNAYPDTLFTIVASPAEPKAGDDVTFTATISPVYAATNWTDDFSFEIWVRQFGNWKIKSCYASPCSFTYNQASIGTLEYAVKRYPSAGQTITEPAAGAYTLNVVSSVQTGDTIAPHMSVFHDPFSPHVGQKVVITAAVDDVSGLNKVELYVDNQLVKTCPQKVKISQCKYETTALSAGQHAYYAVSEDTYANTGTSPTVNLTVLP